MSRTLDIDLERQVIMVSFGYDPDVVAVVKSLPERSFDQSSKQWLVPVEHVHEVLVVLDAFQFHLTPRFRTWRGDSEVSGPADMTVGALNREVQRVLRAAFDAEFWVVGELQGFDRNTKKHLWFELVERRNDDVTARVDAVMYATDAQRVMAKLSSESPDIAWRDGLAVRVRVSAEFYPPSGRFQILIKDVDPTYTAGAILAQRDKVLRALEAERIVRRNIDLEFPACPLRVGLITSVGSDAYNDILDELRASRFAFEISVAHATMQGPTTEESVLQALRWFYRRADQFDVLILARGGGARSDLAWFDSHAIGRAVCLTPIKIIVGVGHHRDRCVVDFVAESLKTPTAAAQAVVARVRDFDAKLESLQTRARRITDHAMTRVNRRLEQLAHRLREGASVRVNSERMRCAKLSHRVAQGAANRVQADRHTLESLTQRLPSAASRATEGALGRLELAHLRVEMSNPARILSKGYVRVRLDGRVVGSVGELRTGDSIEIESRDGNASALITATHAREINDE
ncbi:MAG: exodeoxyribonuclease VII large subunit [bacterium]